MIFEQDLKNIILIFLAQLLWIKLIIRREEFVKLLHFLLFFFKSLNGYNDKITTCIFMKFKMYGIHYKIIFYLNKNCCLFCQTY